MSSVKDTILSIPLLGYSLRKVKSFVNTRKDLEASIDAHIENSSKVVSQMRSDLKSIEKSILKSIEIDKKNNKKTEEELSERINNALKLASENQHPSGKDGVDKQLFVDKHHLDNFYLKFEDKFRGSEDQIENRLKTAYEKYFSESKLDLNKNRVVDIGCGRGELLKVLKDLNISAIGIDLNTEMVRKSKEKGFTTHNKDGVQYLKEQKESSLGAVTGFHIIEHLPFDKVIELFQYAHKALSLGGFVIFETPNPENINVATVNFHMDPSHLKPLPSALIKFLAEYTGFKKVEILKLHPTKPPMTEKSTNSSPLDRFTTYRDYSIIAYK